MTMTDPVADLLTRIRNAAKAKHKFVDIPASNLKRKIVKILLEESYVVKYFNIRDNKQGILRVYLKYDEYGNSVINEIKRVSKPGLRVYASVNKLPRVKNNFGIAIMTTSKGVISNKMAKQLNVGGEILCSVW
ncbi:MAG: 30S ribosomal protein S8 [Candidatus Cloacimonadota bacterium]|nr:ribosomal protein S8 [uncultured bacterium]PID31142.1 MAG: 30S ribosomal protein S8 [Candidatus Cloacimonadota bacterium]PIE79134.1 MAG: 30S ribosomal protein S8 [Candidatus Delongbacteria bacterium]